MFPTTCSFSVNNVYLCSRQSQVVFQSERQLDFTAEAPDLHGLKWCCGG